MSICGSYCNVPKAIFYLLKGDYRVLGVSPKPKQISNPPLRLYHINGNAIYNVDHPWTKLGKKKTRV